MKNVPADASVSLAEWASGVAESAIPASVRRVATTCVIDTVGVALAGVGTSSALAARQYARVAGGPGRSEVLGEADGLTAPAAAFCNATAAHALDFDDNCYAGFVHGSAVIVPAALAMTQEIEASGRDLVTAIAVGAECEYAVGAAIGLNLYEKGWWTTGLLGPIGAGVAAARLLKLDADRMRACIGLAVTGTGGTKACFGSDAKALLAGHASEAGVRWARMAALGASGPDDAFSHSAGFAALHNDGAFDSAALQTLGKVWRQETPGVDVKKYPVCLSSHAAVDLVVDIMSRERIARGDIEEVVCDVPPVVMANLKYALPQTRREAQFSMEFAIAAAILCGGPNLAQLNEEFVRSEDVRSLLPRVRMVGGAMWDRERCDAAPEGASVSLLLKDGRRFDGYLAHARGTAANPMHSSQIHGKFMETATRLLEEEAATRLLQSLQAIDGNAPVGAILSH